ncbi:MAG: peroxiredoxin-like family protein [Planctomycetota bacterium]
MRRTRTLIMEIAVLPELTFLDPDERPKPFSAFGGQPLLVIFLRHIACMACQGHLVDVQTLHDFLEKKGVRVVVVTFTPPKLLKMFLAENKLPFEFVADPSREAYRFFQLRRASVLSFFKPRVLAGYFRRFWSGVKMRKPIEQDVLQLGGDFLFDARGEAAWSWVSKDATDRPTADEIRAAVERLR